MHDKALFLAMLMSHVFMFGMVCAMLSSFRLLGPRVESIGLTEVDRKRLLLLLLLLLAVVEVVVVVGCGTSRGARAFRSASGSNIQQSRVSARCFL